MISQIEMNENPSSEDGDYIVNWHLHYCANLFNQGENQLTAISNQIRSELIKMKSDTNFINKLPGTHNNIDFLKKQDEEMNNALDEITYLVDKFRMFGRKAMERAF